MYKNLNEVFTNAVPFKNGRHLFALKQVFEANNIPYIKNPRLLDKHVSKINNIYFLKFKSGGEGFYSFLKNNYLRNKNLSMMIINAAIDQQKELDLVKYMMGVLGEYFMDFFVKKRWVFSKKITGNKYLDDELKSVFSKILTKDLQNDSPEDLKIKFGRINGYVANVGSNAFLQVYDIAKNNDIIGEGVVDSAFNWNRRRLIKNQIKTILHPINSETVKKIDFYLKNLSNRDLKNLKESGVSATTSIVTTAIIDVFVDAFQKMEFKEGIMKMFQQAMIAQIDQASDTFRSQLFNTIRDFMNVRIGELARQKGIIHKQRQKMAGMVDKPNNRINVLTPDEEEEILKRRRNR